MRSILFIVLILASLPVFAGNAVLLTSLELKPKHVTYLEKKFHDYLKKTDLNLVIHHNTDPQKLYEVLNSEETEALIWVSHAAKEKQTAPGMSAQATILDVYGNDVKNFFTTIPKNLRFLGIVGCQAEDIIKGFRERGNYDQHPQLEIMSFRKRVSMQGGIKKVLKRLRALDKSSPILPAPETELVEIHLAREAFSPDKDMDKSWVEMGDKVLALFADKGVQEQIISLPRGTWEQIENKNIKHNRLLSGPSNSEEFGRLHLSTTEPDAWWSLFELNGRPLGGKNRHLYQYRK